MRRVKYTQGTSAVRDAVWPKVPAFGRKIHWFLEKGYKPHIYQMAFHTMSYEDTGKSLIYRLLVAGRRGGKTLSAAWEVAFYCIHPDAWWWDVKREVSDEPIHVWILVPNYKTAGRAAMRTFEKVLKQAGMSQGHGYKWNRGELFVEFDNGTFVEFKTAEQADNLVGAGIHILWMDEFAIIPNQDAYDYATPALDDNEGVVIGTSTPRGKNWAFELFWGPAALDDPNVGSVEYRTIDNPHFSKARWLLRKRTYHPLKFKQEYEASFDSQAGKELHGDWLQTYELGDLPAKKDSDGRELPTVRDDGSLWIENLALRLFIGVDPAVSLADTADHFALAVLGVTEDNTTGYFLDMWRGRIAFPEQVEMIQALALKWRPIFIGVEKVAFQAALIQQLQRISGMPPVIRSRLAARSPSASWAWPRASGLVRSRSGATSGTSSMSGSTTTRSASPSRTTRSTRLRSPCVQPASCSPVPRWEATKTTRPSRPRSSSSSTRATSTRAP
jgi:hypothetical protein